VVLLANAVTIVGDPHPLTQIAFEVPAAAVAVWLLIRWGILPMMVASFIAELTIYTPLTTDFAAWYSGPMLIVLTTVLALAIWSFAVALAGARCSTTNCWNGPPDGDQRLSSRRNHARASRSWWRTT
jgi:hypothetical protein